ncbi:DNA starvation/stationary phase protection protein [Lactobacillus sp. YT155]|uniref:DNA starvation/stationary phase protection protein n=1 Tax=Lactobacillus sp. YT155 TaxID=3060955 RepID=UPI00265F08D8|nr:DNA starvation/stationary phase protection protein [Lactobacillus sp. YT155]MDO1604796.1 DNA starvation/stationary phase protection protein [Lactobacillus sp. YT155]
MMNIEQLYQQEIKQSEIDHKTPTAGAMTGHIVANLQIFEQKVQQIKWYYVGSNKISISEHLQKLLYDIVKFKDQLGDTLLDELELVPSTSQEFVEYTMLKEDSKIKYMSNSEMFKILAEDIQTNMMFITRAVKLAETEDLVNLESSLVDLLKYSKRELRLLKAQANITMMELKTELSDEEN